MIGRPLPLAAALALLASPSASAQQFPVDEAYRPWPCDTGVMTDPFQDESGATFERDLVGDVAAPAGLRAADADFLYVRLRVDQDPAPGGNPRPFSWALLVDTDADPTTYEVMLAADGGAGTVSIFRNTAGTPGDARDAPDVPPVQVDSWSVRARSVIAPGSSYGGTPDWFVEFAFAWADLAAVGIGPETPVRVWAATSSASPGAGMTGDFACRATGAPVLGASWPRTTPDPAQDTDGDGFTDATEIQSGTDPHDPASHPAGAGDAPKLGGGGGCGHGEGGVGALAVAAAMLAYALRRDWAAPPRA
jgi:Bacterial TSP3 repeat